MIDHHASSDDLGGIEFKDLEAEATGVLILEMADALDLTIPPAVAMPLFCAVATDTGWFRFRGRRESTMRVAARLIDLGAQAGRNISAALRAVFGGSDSAGGLRSEPGHARL